MGKGEVSGGRWERKREVAEFYIIKILLIKRMENSYCLRLQPYCTHISTVYCIYHITTVVYDIHTE